MNKKSAPEFSGPGPETLLSVFYNLTAKEPRSLKVILDAFQKQYRINGRHQRPNFGTNKDGSPRDVIDAITYYIERKIIKPSPDYRSYSLYADARNALRRIERLASS